MTREEYFNRLHGMQVALKLDFHICVAGATFVRAHLAAGYPVSPYHLLAKIDKMIPCMDESQDEPMVVTAFRQGAQRMIETVRKTKGLVFEHEVPTASLLSQVLHLSPEQVEQAMRDGPRYGKDCCPEGDDG